MTTEFVRDSGASIVSLNILERRAPVRWMLREQAANPQDNGWRFISAADDQAYLDDPANMRVASFNAVCEIEPALIPILFLPIGSDLELIVHADGRREIVDASTGAPVALP